MISINRVIAARVRDKHDHDHDKDSFTIACAGWSCDDCPLGITKWPVELRIKRGAFLSRLAVNGTGCYKVSIWLEQLIESGDLGDLFEALL